MSRDQNLQFQMNAIKKKKKKRKIQKKKLLYMSFLIQILLKIQNHIKNKKKKRVIDF